MVYASFRAEPFPQLFTHSDYVGHFLLFCLFAFSVHHLLKGVVHTGVLLVLLLGLAVCAELLQASDLLPHRHYDKTDIMMNIGGLLLGLSISSISALRLKRMDT
jgi:VanZ family protein